MNLKDGMKEMEDMALSLQAENENLRDEVEEQRTGTFYTAAQENNIAKWQLDLKEDIERIEHLLRGEYPTLSNGRTIWVKSKDEAKIPFNDYGVGKILNILSFYLNRNTLLSNYDEDTINGKVKQFGKELNNTIFLEYDVMGMDTLEKRKMYFMIVRQLVDVVHSAYLRALGAGERTSLRKQVSVHQNDNGSAYGYPQQQRRSMLPSFFKG